MHVVIGTAKAFGSFYVKLPQVSRQLGHVMQHLICQVKNRWVKDEYLQCYDEGQVDFPGDLIPSENHCAIPFWAINAVSHVVATEK